MTEKSSVEVKAKPNVESVDLKSLLALAEEGKLKRPVYASLEPRIRRVGDITIPPHRQFLKAPWSGEHRYRFP